MKTDAMDAGDDGGVGDGSEAGNIVVGSQLQIVRVVSTAIDGRLTEPSRDAASYWSVAPASISVEPVAGPGRGLIGSVEGWRLATSEATTSMTMTM